MAKVLTNIHLFATIVRLNKEVLVSTKQAL